MPFIPSMGLKLTQTQADFLIDNAVNIRRPITHYLNEDATRRVLIEEKLIRYNENGSAQRITPRYTTVTEKGREAACAILGNMADQLVKAGYKVDRPVIAFGHIRDVEKILHTTTRHVQEDSNDPFIDY